MKKFETLDDCRKRINEIDDALFDLINERGNVAHEVGRIKGETGLKTYHIPERENAIIQRLINKNNGPYKDEHIETIFNELFSATLALEKPLSVAYLGPKWTYSYQATVKELGSSADLLPCNTIVDVFQAVEKGIADYGMVPIENSIHGSVLVTLDQLINTNLKIISERSIRISHMLLSSETDLANITAVYSHEQPLAQCSHWLKEHLPNATLKSVSSTAAAAKTVKDTPGTAAIGSEELGNANGLNILARHVEDHPNNYTRFFLMGHKSVEKTDNAKTSIIVTIEDKTGALYELLKAFAAENISLTKIESRPIKGDTWKYCFFIDFLEHIESEVAQRAMKNLQGQGASIKILGSYLAGCKQKID